MKALTACVVLFVLVHGKLSHAGEVTFSCDFAISTKVGWGSKSSFKNYFSEDYPAVTKKYFSIDFGAKTARDLVSRDEKYNCSDALSKGVKRIICTSQNSTKSMAGKYERDYYKSIEIDRLTGWFELMINEQMNATPGETPNFNDNLGSWFEGRTYVGRCSKEPEPRPLW